MHADKERFWTAVTYAQDFSEEGASLGPQTILRLRKIVDARNGGYNIRAVVLAGGFGPEISEYPKQTRAFSAMMAEWLTAEGKMEADTVYHSDQGWNCIEVTMEMIRQIKVKHLPKNVLVVSTGFHIFPRMWTTWTLLCAGKKGWSLAFVPDWTGTYDIWHERAGTAKYIPMAIWYRLKN
jgi:tartrate dehydratase beta subunit/fumarate hydratase class I family protein